jgi:hypothetical protein
LTLPQHARCVLFRSFNLIWQSTLFAVFVEVVNHSYPTSIGDALGMWLEAILFVMIIAVPSWLVALAWYGLTQLRVSPRLRCVSLPRIH